MLLEEGQHIGVVLDHEKVEPLSGHGVPRLSPDYSRRIRE
jgi:hypothetical protein